MGQTGKSRIKRFSVPQRLFHIALMLSFLIQAASGLSRMYIETAWGKRLSWLFGGYDSALTVHKYVGIFMILGLVVHSLYLLSKIDWHRFPHSLFGPDSLLPHPRDIKDFFHHIGWFLGIAKAPRFDRWAYWEKFDYWAVFWGIVVMGGTGLILAYSLSSTRIIPGWGLNVALWIHRIEAILAMAHVFIIHFFIAHLRRHSFPMDQAMFEGSVMLEDAMAEKPAWVERLKKDKRLELVLAKSPASWCRALCYVFGYMALAFGIYLLVNGIVYSPYITLR